MKDRVKKALKRAASGLMAVLLAVCLVGTPRAKAVVSEGALLGSIFGSLLVSMGYSWAADNMDAPTFGESIYKLTQEFDEAMKDTGIQLIRDLNLAGLTANGAGKLQFGYAWVQAARSFAEWFEGKFFTGDKTSAVVSGGTTYFTWDDGTIFNLTDTEHNKAGTILMTSTELRTTGTVKSFYYQGHLIEIRVGDSVDSNGFGTVFPYVDGDKKSGFWMNENIYDLSFCNVNGFLRLCYNVKDKFWDVVSGDIISVTATESIPLTAEKPQEVHYPDVAEDGSQVYEITVDGVTATDIEGIIQGAVDRILAGTAAIAGSIADAQAKPGEEVVNPEIEPYKVGLSSVFPFCIPFDVYNMVTMFVAEPEAPSAEWSFTLPWSSQEYSVGWDLAAFDGVARVCRDMELVLFAVGLAVITYKVIKW